MKRRFLFVLSAMLTAASSTALAGTPPVLSAQELDALRGNGDIRIVDIRPGAAYAENHIPGAVSAPYASWRGPANNPGKPPELTTLARLLQQLGIDYDTHAAFVSAGDTTTVFGAAARAYWTLQHPGLEKLSVLNGGITSWGAAGLPQDQERPQVTASAFEPRVNTAILATQSDVLAQIDNPNARLVDARPKAFFLGETKAPTA